MKPGKAYDVFSPLKPTILLSQISGVAYFKRINKWIVFYRILILIILVLCFVHEIPTVAFWISESKSLHAVLAAFETFLRWTLLFFNNMVTAFRNPKIYLVLDDLNKLKLDMKESAFKKVYQFQIFQVSFNFFMISCFMVLGHHFIWFNINKKWYTSMIYIFTEFYIAIGNLQFSAFAYLFGEYFKTFNKKLSSRNPGENYFAQPELKGLRKKHLKLSHLIGELVSCYAIQLLLFVLLSLVEIVYSLRAFFLHAVNKRSSEVWTTIPVLAFFHMVFWGSYYFLAVIQVVSLCERIVSEWARTSIIVHKMINKTMEPYLERELELFSMQILRNGVKFAASGVFTLDFALIHSIIAAVTTYLVVLISIREDNDY